MNIKTQRALGVSLGAAGLVALGFAGWWMSPMHAHAAAEPTAPVVLRHDGMQVVVPENSPLRQSLSIRALQAQVVVVPFSLPAIVEGDPARTVKVLTPVTGRIASLDKGLGDAVKPGDVLLRIDSPDLMQAMSDAQKARSVLALARQALARQRELAGSEIAARRDVEQAQNDFDQAASEAARAEAKLVQLGAAAGARARAEGATLNVRSPLAGRVIDLTAARGAYWNDATASLMTVADLSSVFVTASVDERDLGAVYVGQSVSVNFDAYPGEAMEASVRYVGEVLDADTRKVKVRMRFDNRDGRLRPGMFARATFMARPHSGLVVPAAAVVQNGFESRVFVEVAPWHFESRVVQTGPVLGDSIEIKAGLESGERVVAKDGVLLDD